jgi:hypothetical protein
MAAAGLVVLGVFVGAFGTMIGAGGGFLLMPVLLFLYPRERPDVLTSISLLVVFFNAASGTAAYARMKRVDYRSGIIFSAAAVPGAVLGALTVSAIPRRVFDLILGGAILAGALFLLVRPVRHADAATTNTSDAAANRRGLGAILSLFVGYISSLLGIGGGIIHVPLLVHLLRFPVHIATATSHFILANMALAGSAVHVATGTLSHGWHRALWLSLGAILGAQLGAWLSGRMRGTWLIRTLAVALIFVGFRVFWDAL